MERHLLIMERTVDYQPIENYGVIGNLQTVALVGMNGSIDFLCLPRFDSPSVLAALLDHAKGGRFQIAPSADGFDVKQSYLADTNILLTRFSSDGGVAEIADFMPICQLGRGNELVRQIKGVRGAVRFRLECAPKFDYARAGHHTERRGNDVIFRPDDAAGPDLCLRGDEPLRVTNGAAVAEFTLRAGQTKSFVLHECRPRGASPSDAPDYAEAALHETAQFWRDWMRQSRYRGRWREMVNRSALTLKLLISQPHGAIVAAPTFSLPGQVGGPHNWDYRYTWMRDSSLTIDALMRLGYMNEASAFADWIEQRCLDWDGAESLQPVYRVDGGRKLREQCLTHFEGYRQSRPVRIGNSAYTQLQLDIGGELLDSIHRLHQQGKAISREFWQNLTRLIDWVSRHWRKPDKSIWEFRTQSRHFLFSRALCWVALDRGIRLAEGQSLPAPLPRWRATRDRIYRDIHQNLWDDKLHAFVQYRGAKSVDASALLLPVLGFISPVDPRWLSTMRAIEDALSEDFLLYRYNGPHASPSQGGPRGTFCMCSFWWAECLAQAGDLSKSQHVFERMLNYANHLGLYAEQISPTGRHLGNFPQGLSHSALIRAACALNAALDDETKP
jgi:GH15 family glucan-1,4-alpha-glucosidase